MKDSWPFNVALRGGGVKPPSGALAEDRGAEREGKGFRWRSQVGIRKTLHQKPHRGSLLKCRNWIDGIETWDFGVLGMSLAGARLLARWCPAWRWREPDLLLLRGTGEGVSRNCRPDVSDGERECPKRRPRKGLSTVAGRAGGLACSSCEVPA